MSRRDPLFAPYVSPTGWRKRWLMIRYRFGQVRGAIRHIWWRWSGERERVMKERDDWKAAAACRFEQARIAWDLACQLQYPPSGSGGALEIAAAEIDGVVGFAAHNAKFETQWVNPGTLWLICTYKVALRAWPDAPSHSNGALRYWLQDQGLIAPDHERTMPPHRAGPDAYVSAHILRAAFERGVTGAQMVAWTKEPALQPRCPIGDHRGKPWAEVPHGFLTWIIGKDSMEFDLRWNAQRELDRRSQ